MADIEKKAFELIAQAEKRKTPHGIFSFFFRSSSHLEEASELYVRAANTFKRAKNWNEAGKAFVEAAKLNYRTDTKHDAAKCYVDAAVCFKKSDPLEAVDCYLKAIEIYTDMGRFVMAAKHHVSVAEIYESDCLDVPKAIAHYEQAADYYKGEESTSSANRCLTFVAKHAAQMENYQKAIDIYEEIGTTTLESSLLKYSSKEYFFKAAICHMCVDNLNAQLALKKYEEMAPSFSDSRECKLLKALITAVEEQNRDAFTEAVKDFDSISRLDEWYTTLLLRVKKNILDTPDLL